MRVGVNLNNREPLLTDEYTVGDMIDLSAEAEAHGYDSVWIGDNLLERPRLEPLTSLATMAGRTESVGLGTACMITPMRNPVQFAQAWATLDMLSDGRMLLGACMGTPTDLGGKQYETVGVPMRRRATVLEEGIEVMRQLWRDGTVTFDGDYFQYEDVSFDTGNERFPLRPVQDEPPVYVASNPSVHGKEPVQDKAVRRIVDVGDGWLTCCRADHPGDYEQQWNAIVEYADETGVDPDNVGTAYQVTLNVADTTEEAEEQMHEYIADYYPAMYDPDEMADWGPMGTPEEVAEWFETFNDLGCETFVVRFGAYDQRGQLERFADEILPEL
jgi:alkanesulfonate monooxygenase SsuD/methylene tetrahydromethanopterin reductase-like flavin-dependent oxidoreductase (luciferase family)